MSDQLTEVLQRVTRLESRLCRLGEHMGTSLRTTSKGLRITEHTEHAVSVATPALDIAVSEVHSWLRKQGIEGKVVLLYFRFQLIARLYPVED